MQSKVDGLTIRQRRFAFEYVRLNLDAKAALLAAGYTTEAQSTQINQLLALRAVQSAIDDHMETAATVACLSPGWVLRQWMQIAGADPAEIMRLMVDPCPSCWRAIDDESLRSQLEDPDPECKTCKGRGIRSVDLTATKKLSPAARRLFAGVEQNDKGVIKIKLRDQDAALRSLASYLGMERKVAEISGPGGGPIPLSQVRTADQMSEEELALIVQGGPLQIVDGGISGGTEGVTDQQPLLNQDNSCP